MTVSVWNGIRLYPLIYITGSAGIFGRPQLGLVILALLLGSGLKMLMMTI
jgi:hypothetical protein